MKMQELVMRSLVIEELEMREYLRQSLYQWLRPKSFPFCSVAQLRAANRAAEDIASYAIILKSKI